MDIIIKNGLITDGTRRRPFMGNVLIDAGKIVKVTPGEPDESITAKKVIDAKGHVVAPGFMDIHCHSDLSYLSAPTFESMLTGGTTFQLAGLCGNSVIPISENNIKNVAKPHSVLGGNVSPDNFKPRGIKTYGEDFDAHHTSINAGMMVGHGALRSGLIGYNQRQLTSDELNTMCEKLDAELKAGGFGVSLGLIYPPGSCCDTDEIKAMARVCAANDKIVAVHMRNENLKVFEALDEMIGVARETGVRLEISHFKLMGKQMWGRADELLAKIDLARAEGIRICCDQYPYTASRSLLAVCFPGRALDGGHDVFSEKLKDEDFWLDVSAGGTLPEMDNRGGAENIEINTFEVGREWPEIRGLRITEVAKMLGVTNQDAVREILIRCGARVNCIYHSQSPEDNLTIMSRRDISVISDGTAFNLDSYNNPPHPRCNGTFPRFFRLVRENRLMPIEDAVFKTSALPATVLKLNDRYGYLKEGYEACVTVFDKENIKDNATYKEPYLKSEGVDCVIVNGQVAYENGQVTEARAGHFIYSR